VRDASTGDLCLDAKFEQPFAHAHACDFEIGRLEAFPNLPSAFGLDS